MCEQTQKQRFPQTQLYKEIEMYCGREAKSNCCLMRELRNRELGLVSRTRERGLTNLYVPNHIYAKLREPPSHAYVNDRANICHLDRSGSKLAVAYLTPTLPEQGIQLLNACNGTYSLLKSMEPDQLTWGITDMDFSPCGKFLAYSTFSESIYMKSINGPNIWEHIKLPVTHYNELVSSLRFSPCGRKIVGSFRTISCFSADIETFAVDQVPHTSFTKLNRVSAVSFLSDRNPHVVACGHGVLGIVNVFDMRCYRCAIATFGCHFEGITSIDARNDGNYFLTNAKDDSAKIWDLRKPTLSKMSPTQQDACLMTYRGHKVATFPQSAKFSPLELTGQRYIYAGCATGRIVVYDVLTGNIKTSFQGHSQLVSSLNWHPVRSEIVSASWEGDIHINGYKATAGANSDTAESAAQANNVKINGIPYKKAYLCHMSLLTKYMHTVL